MDLGLKGKVAVITGASDGIGRAAARVFAREGALVALCARGKEKLQTVVDEIEQSGGRAWGMPADVGTAEGPARFVQGVLDQFGRLDILVNNAGTSLTGKFLDLPDGHYQSDLDLKVFGAIRCARLAIPHMQKQGGGRILNITTIGGKTPAPGSLPTSMSRAAGLAITKALSKEFARDNILVNTVCIGLIKSGQHDSRADAAGISREEHYGKMAEGVPLGRVGEAEEAGKVIAFLCSGAASYVTGASLNLDGGICTVL